MKLGHFFIDRPIFAISLSVVILIMGIAAMTRLPVSQFPEVVPPTIVVTAQYPGADAATIADTVATPIEQEVNGVDGMLYMQSHATNDGELILTVTFALGTDVDEALVLVQNRVQLAEARLPEEVRRTGVSVRKNSPDMLMVVQVFSPDGSRDQLYVSNYATQRVEPVLQRLPGVGSVTVFGGREYAMRIWLDPDRIADLELTAGEVVAAVRAQNVQVAGGQLAQPPVATDRAYQPSLTLRGRLDEVAEFERIIVKRGEDGRITRLGDVARIELGAQTYTTNARFNGTPYVALLIFQQPGENALETSDQIQAAMAGLSEDFPQGIEYRATYNPTEFFTEASIEALQITILEAIVLVVLVVVVFLQNARATIIPVLAIPVSLVGTFIVMSALGYSINTLTLFGLVLAVGIVVDDAIVVVENVERYLKQGLSPRDAARKTMTEVAARLRHRVDGLLVPGEGHKRWYGALHPGRGLRLPGAGRAVRELGTALRRHPGGAHGAALGGVALMGQDNNLLTQVALIVLVGLAARNAILIVEFARQLEDQGRSMVAAAVEAACLRPILMTSFAFILGVVPLMVATGAGAELRQALGTAVFFGMLGVTAFGLIFTPVFYVVTRQIAEVLAPAEAERAVTDAA